MGLITSKRLRENEEFMWRLADRQLDAVLPGGQCEFIDTVGGVEIPAGSTVMLLHGATGRDPRHFECPHELRIDRLGVRQHISFGAGIHTCPGAPRTALWAPAGTTTCRPT